MNSVTHLPSRIAVLVFVALVSACSGSDGAAPEPGDDAETVETGNPNTGAVPSGAGRQERGSLDWAGCGPATPGLPDTECASLTVPLDHADPDGGTIDLAVKRTLATGDDADRIGSLVFNPGGPGASGVDFLDQVALITSAEVADRFDLVSFDPRGVGESTSIDCDIDLDDAVELVPPDDDEAWRSLLDATDDEIDSCGTDDLELARYVGTNNAARDLDLLRDALGDERLSYVGYSYGTRLGATYAELFPDRVRALVLDAAVAPTRSLVEIGIGQAAGFDRALANFAAACDADEDCLLTELGPTLEVLDGLRDEIAEVGSFPTDDPARQLTPGELDLGVLASLYSKDTWPFLAQALFLAETEQDGTLLQVLGDSLLGRGPDGTYSNLQTANGYINCADDPARPDAEVVREQANEVASASESFDELLRADTFCLGVPDALDPIEIGPAVGAEPILVIGNTGDPATPFEWSEELAASLDSGVLVRVEAEGHTAYGTIDCVADTIDAYLIDLDVPDEGSGCSDNVDADFFVPEGTSEIDLLLAVFDCFRDNGVDLPEIDSADVLADPSGEGFGDLLDPTDPAVAAAVGQCAEAILAVQDLGPPG